MRIIIRCLFTVLFAGAFFSLHAQTKLSTIRGKILTENAQPADDAVVVLLKSPDSSAYQSIISNKNGSFGFDGVQPGNYLLLVTKLGYNKKYSGPYQISSGETRDMGAITLIAAPNQLQGVTITGKKDYIEVRPDKTVLNVEQNITTTGNSVYDVLSTAPGVKVIEDGVLYRGGQKALIAINGRPILLTGEELINLLKNYQSNSVSQIELIDNPSAKYDASSGGGMINIVLKKNKDLGSNASISQTVAYGDKYKFNTGITYNLRTSKMNIFASYNFVDNKIPHTINTSRNINTGTELDNFNLNYEADNKAKNNSFSLGADYQLTTRQTIGFLINGYDNNSNISKHNTTIISTNGLVDSSINTTSAIKRDIYNFNYNLNYKADLGKSGKSVLSADVDYSNYHRHSDESLRNDFFDATGQADGESLFYTNNSPSHITVRSENVDFSQVLSKATSLEAGIKNSQVKSNNMIDFEQQVNGVDVPVPSLTDHFVYNERINAAYLKLSTKFNKTSFSVSLRGEQTNSTATSSNATSPVNSSYFNLFPNIQLSQTLDANNQLTLFYIRNINRPNYQDLNPFIGYVDQFYYSTGNPFLKPSYINTFQLSNLYLNKYKVSLSVIKTDNYFNTIFQQNDSTKVYTTTKVNIGTRYQYIAQFNVPVTLTRWWDANADLNVYHESYAYNIDTIAKKNTNGLIFSLNQNFKLTPKLTAQIVGDYESPTYYVISQYKESFYVNAGMSYTILGGNGRIRLVVNDIFNSDFLNKYHSSFANLDITGREKIGSRFVQTTFTYRFGNSSLKARANKESIEEQKRLGGSSNEN